MKRWLTQIEPNLLDYVNVNKLSRKDKPSKPLRNKLSAEYIILFLGLLGLLIFVWMMIFFFVPFLRQRPQPLSSSPPVMVATSTPDFILPPTWTPEPTEVIIPTLGGTQVVSGEAPTRVYTPRATSLSGIPRPDLSRPSSIEIIDLARILQGESAGDKQAAYMVGWVAKNRLFHVGYGDTYAEVSGGFFGYLAGVQPREEFQDLARRIIRAKEDPTNGALYALSRTDITKLGIPAGRADIAFGEWFFFNTWPLEGR